MAILFAICAINFCDAQDPIFSQFYSSPTQLNPAFAGNSNHPVFYLQYRNQWPSIQSAYTTIAASYDQYFPQQNSGLGFSILSDNAGDGVLRNVKVSGIYSYGLKLRNDIRIKGGLELGYVQNRLDGEKLLFSDQIDPFSGPILNGGTLIQSGENFTNGFTNGYLDISTGFLAYNPYFYLGLSLEHVNNPRSTFLDSSQSFVGIPTRISLHFGGQINFSEGNKVDEGSFLSPGALLAKQGDFYQFNVGFYTKFRVLLGGLWFRHTFENADALIFSLGTTYNDIKIQYSFDYTISALSINSGGAHEISIKYILSSVGSDERDINDCLNMFR